MNNSNHPRKKKNKLRSFFKNLLIFIVMLGLLSGAGLIGLFAVVAKDLPAWDAAQLSGAITTFVYDDQGSAVAGLHAGENRTEITLDQVPQDLISAFIATEDRKFYEHHGVNYRGMMRSLVSNVTSGDLTGQGASTITQQLARNAFLSFDKKWERKLKEILLAFKIESNYSKDEILAMYMNLINFGSGAYGVQAASQTYFGKDVEQLSLPECAMLAGLPNAPSRNPYQDESWAKKRQKVVLDSMVDTGYIDRDTADQAFAQELVYTKTLLGDSQYGYYIDAVIDEALDILTGLQIYNEPENALYRSGLKIYTTMDADVQKYAEQYYADPAHFLQQTNALGEQVQSAMAVFDNETGSIKALMGGRNYEQKRGFNRATNAYRQPGSSIKPITVYSPALEAGFMPFCTLDDSPITYKLSSGGVWNPKNYDLSYRGMITMRTAVKDSVNTYAIQMLDQVGIRAGFDSGVSMGLELIDSPGMNDLALAPLALGGLTRGATPVQMSAAYGAIANGGVYIKPHCITKIVDEDGVELYSYRPESHRVMSEQTSWLMGSMMRTVVEAGTGARGKVPGVVTAGKTGTSEEYRDSWFCGFTPSYSMAVWIGFDKDYTMKNYPSQFPGETAYGGNFPARAFSAILTEAHKGIKSSTPRPMPGGIINVSVCSISGQLPSEACPEDKIISEYCLASAVPTDTCEMHQLVSICPESGKLAGRYCPDSELKSMVICDPKSKTPGQIPEETCDIHTELTFPGLFSREVYICTDPRHEGKLYQANTPNPFQTGGCPQQYLQKMILQPDQSIPSCSLEDHKLTRKKAGDVIRDITPDRD